MTDKHLTDPALIPPAPAVSASAAGGPLVTAFGGILPGLAYTVVIAAAAYAIRQVPGMGLVSPLILAIVIGMALHNIFGTAAIIKPGVKFALRRILRFAIVLLGLQLTFEQVRSVGVVGFSIVAFTLFATFFVTRWIGRAMGVDRQLSELIAAGTAICGASAVIATNTVTDAPDEDVAYAVACVTVFGSIAMFVYPLLPGLLGLSPHAYGLWAGASIHEIAQVVAAAYQDGTQAGDFGTIAKLSRVMMLAPVVIGLGFMARRARSTEHSRAKPVPLPWFVLGFVALVVVNSFVTIPAPAKMAIVTATTFLLSVALAAMGLETDIAKLRMKGLRPFFLGLAAFLFIATFSLMLIRMTT